MRNRCYIVIFVFVFLYIYIYPYTSGHVLLKGYANIVGQSESVRESESFDKPWFKPNLFCR